MQGVGYRERCRLEAQVLDVRGWVRNRVDGSVEALMVGTTAQLDALVNWLERGPPAARVTQVRLADAPLPSPLPVHFEVRSTA